MGEIGISLGDSEGNGIARGVKNGGFGRFRLPGEISGERRKCWRVRERECLRRVRTELELNNGGSGKE